MSPKSRPRRLFVPTAVLSAITVLLLVAWFYFFRYGASRNRPPSPNFPLTDTEKGGIDVLEVNPHSPSMTSPGQPGISRAPVVKLPQGTYIGATIPADSRYPKAVEVFRGIPYAQTTAGVNRFRPAVPLRLSHRTFNAVALGQACPGSNATNITTTEALVEGEDCLNLNVYRPRGSGAASQTRRDGRAALLPVVIYVHGGGFNGGVGTERNMASFVSWAREPLIALNFNYRIGALGFLPSAVTAREGLLNLGLRDQQFFFAWAKDNVAAFGGDPDNITVMGLSAGAHSIGHHLMYYSNSSTPAPFAKAILESGATTARSVFYPTHPRHLVQFREFLIAAGIEHTPEEKIFTELRNLPVERIKNASQAIWNQYNASVCWPFQPVIDGPNPLSNSSHGVLPSKDDEASGGAVAVIPDLPIRSWRHGNHLRIPVMTGFSTNEGTMFVPQHADTNEEFRSFFKTLIPSFRPEDLDQLEALYPDPVTDPSSPYKKVLKGMGRQWARLDAAYSHFAYTCPVLHTAHFLSTADSQDSSSSVTFAKSSHPPPPADQDASSSSSSSSKRSISGNSRQAPVYIYRYAATATWGTANHGDEAPVVAHDMNVIAPHGNATRPGIHAVADAMHGAWVNFILSADGDPNPVETPTTAGGAAGSGKAATATTAARWAPFESPFVRRRRRRRNDGSGDDDDDDDDGGGGVGVGDRDPAGSIMVFGEGNDEREPGGPAARRRGTAAKLEALSVADMERCRFWWDRVEMSQGAGRPRKESLGRGEKAKL